MGEHAIVRDAELLAAAKRDPEAFGKLYDRYAVRAYGWARRAGLGEVDALDLVAELFAQAWIGRRRFHDPGDGSAAGWLHGIARNLLASRRRRGRIELKARRRLGMPLTAEPDAGAALAERLDATASRPALEAAMGELPPTHRQAVRMRVVDELDYPELALRLNCSENDRPQVGLARTAFPAPAARANPMNQEDEMTETNIPDLTPALGRIRADLVRAVARDRSRAARRHKTYLVAAVAVVAVGAVGGAIAAVTGAFSPAPAQVKQTFEDLNSGPDAPGVDASRAVQIGVIDEHPAYAAPTEGGGFCLYFAPNPGVVQRSGPSGSVQRSGPSGSVCTASDPGPNEIALTPQMGHDGGFAFGRVGTADAVEVEIELPDASGIVTASVGPDRFFLAGLPERALTALTHGKTVSAVARNADGTILARFTPEGLGLGMPTETGPVANN